MKLNKTNLLITTSILFASPANSQSFYACIPCPGGQYLSNGSCKTCQAGTFTTGGATSCTKCPAGTYSGSGANVCSPCSAGTYSQSGSSSCSTCPAGTYSASGANTCTKCPAGTYSQSGSSSCTPCPAGQTSSAGAGSCSPCPAGNFCLGGQASACMDGTWAPAGSSACRMCGTMPVQHYYGSGTIASTAQSSNQAIQNLSVGTYSFMNCQTTSNVNFDSQHRAQHYCYINGTKYQENGFNYFAIRCNKATGALSLSIQESYMYYK